jgi:threonine dehydrogenase-like Zn-dependent dehydrogenase
MKANCWFGANNVQVTDVPDPVIINPRDAIVRITSTAICGSDLHLLDGFIPSMEPGDILGHEFMGEVVDVGPSVKNLKAGDRVEVPARHSFRGSRDANMPVLAMRRQACRVAGTAPSGGRTKACLSRPGNGWHARIHLGGWVGVKRNAIVV